MNFHLPTILQQMINNKWQANFQTNTIKNTIWDNRKCVWNLSNDIFIACCKTVFYSYRKTFFYHFYLKRAFSFQLTSTPTQGRFFTLVWPRQPDTLTPWYPKLQNPNRSLEKKLCFTKNGLNFFQAAPGPSWLVSNNSKLNELKKAYIFFMKVTHEINRLVYYWIHSENGKNLIVFCSMLKLFFLNFFQK